MRTPLTKLMGYLDILQHGKYGDEAQRAEYLRRAADKALQMRALSDEMFRHFQVEAPPEPAAERAPQPAEEPAQEGPEEAEAEPPETPDEPAPEQPAERPAPEAPQSTRTSRGSRRGKNKRS